MILILLCSINTSAQIRVTGKVTDGTEPLPGVNVKVKGSQIGTASDAAGKFSLTTAKTEDILIFTYIGFKQKEVAANSPEIKNLVLEVALSTLDQVVVVGYGVSKVGDLTGSVTSIKGETLNQTGATTFTEALQGRIAGVKVNSQSGEPGSSINIQIRGANSITASSSPLFVIDGMQIDVNDAEVATSAVGGSTGYNPLSSINPNDIESIEVLKDASATAIYGARGANGVILVTTKSGKGKKSRLNFDATFGTSEATKKLNMLGPQDYIDFRFEFEPNSIVWGVDTDGNGTLDKPVDANNFDQFNWQDLILRTGLTRKYNASLQNGSENTDFTMGFGYLDQEGVVISNDYKRYSAQMKINHRLSKKLEMGMNLNYGRTITDGAVSSGGGQGSFSGLIQSMYNEKPIGIFVAQENEGDGQYIPLTSMFLNSYKNVTLDRAIGGAFINMEIAKGLKLRVSASGNTSFSKLQEFYGKQTRWGRTNDGRAGITDVQTSSYTQSNTLTYTKRIKNQFLTLLAGQEFNGYSSENSSIRAYSFEDESTGVFDISKANVFDKPTSNITEINRLSFFGRANYNFNYKYYFTATLRADGSSNFGSNNRFGYFPSAAFAWKINNEKFFSGIKNITNLKLRLSYGVTGNDRIPAYAAIATLGSNNYTSDDSPLFGLAPTVSPNSNLKWESTTQYDIGIDLGLFKERITITADVYKKTTNDLLLDTPIPSQTGYSRQFQNIGKVQNKGFELSISSTNISKENFNWSTSINLDRNLNKVLSLGSATFLPVTIGNGFLTDVGRVIVGQPLGTGFGYVANGNYQFADFNITDNSGNSINPSIINNTNFASYTYSLKPGITSISAVRPVPGDRKYKDLDGNNIINANDRTIISNSNPDLNVGFSNQFRYKQFDLGIFFEGVFGNQIMNAFVNNSEAGLKGAAPQYNITEEYYNNRWTPENPSNTYSRLKNNTNDFVSSYYVEDATFVRLKNLSIGYTLGKRISNKLKANSIRLNVTADNLYVWTNYSGLDPDIRSGNALLPGYDRLSYPRARTVYFGLNAEF